MWEGRTEKWVVGEREKQPAAVNSPQLDTEVGEVCKFAGVVLVLMIFCNTAVKVCKFIDNFL